MKDQETELRCFYSGHAPELQANVTDFIGGISSDAAVLIHVCGECGMKSRREMRDRGIPFTSV